MKKILLIFFAIFSIEPSVWCAETPKIEKREITGNIVCENAPCIGATIICTKTGNGEAADIDGNFKLTCPKDESVQIEFLGMSPKTIPASELDANHTNLKITLENKAQDIEAVAVDHKLEVGDKCNNQLDSEDIKSSYQKCTDKMSFCENGKMVCIIEECAKGYKVDKELNICIEDLDCTEFAQESDPNVKQATMNDNYECEIQECKNTYIPRKDINKCISKEHNLCLDTKGATWDETKSICDCGSDAEWDAKAKQCIDKEEYNCKKATGTKWDTNTCTCTDQSKEWDSDKAKCVEKSPKCTDDEAKAHPNATKTKRDSKTGKCIATQCKCGYELDGTECKKWAENKQCDKNSKPALPNNAKTALMKCDGDKAYCEISACESDAFEPSDDKKKCEKKEVEKESNKEKRCKAAGGTWDDNKCTCPQSGCTCSEENEEWDNDKVKCVKIKEEKESNKEKKCSDAGGTWTNERCTCDETKCKCGKNQKWDEHKIKCVDKLERHSDEEIADLEKKVADAKAKEQSLTNRLTAGAAMGAMGIGGMQLASSLSEQKADKAAEIDMAAYLATMRCSYADGKNVKGGEKNIVIPGGNELLPLYTEYVKLAKDLKIRKEALSLTPGIESEEIIDVATTGLYDDVSVGKSAGAFASVARALTDENSEDAKKWAAQKEETSKNLKTGAITAGVGAVVGIAGNVLSNVNLKKSDDQKIKKTYEKIVNAFESAQKTMDNAPATNCNTQITKNGGKVPDCTCKNDKHIFHPDWLCSESNDTAHPDDTIKVFTAGENQTLIASIKFPSDKSFAPGKPTLTTNASRAIDTIKTAIKNNSQLFKNDNYTILITGHTDRIQPSGKDNTKLSGDRATAIQKALTTNNTVLNTKQILSHGLGSSNCSQDANDNDADCRYIEIELYAAPATAMDNLGAMASGLKDGLAKK